MVTQKYGHANPPALGPSSVKYSLARCSCAAEMTELLHELTQSPSPQPYINIIGLSPQIEALLYLP